MDLVAEKLLSSLKTEHAAAVAATQIRPSFHARFTSVPILGRRRVAFNADRVMNRLHDYPRYLADCRRSFDLFHVCDHSYANVVHTLRAERTGVFCHDLDTFKSLLDRDNERRPRWFREIARHILTGMQKAAVVFYTTSAVRAQIERHGLLDTQRLVQASYGIAREFAPDVGEASANVTSLLQRLNGAPFLLHVGSCIPRKRVDVLLETFAAVHRSRAELRLIQVGGEWSPAHRIQLARHQLEGVVCQVSRMNQADVASLYQRAAMVLMPSEAEGFGLPVVEALASGSLVVASDIPVFREVGGPGAVYCQLANVEEWTRTVGGLLGGALPIPERTVRLAWSQQFSWAEHTRRIVSAYQRLWT